MSDKTLDSKNFSRLRRECQKGGDKGGSGGDNP